MLSTSAASKHASSTVSLQAEEVDDTENLGGQHKVEDGEDVEIKEGDAVVVSVQGMRMKET